MGKDLVGKFETITGDDIAADLFKINESGAWKIWFFTTLKHLSNLS